MMSERAGKTETNYPLPLHLDLDLDFKGEMIHYHWDQLPCICVYFWEEDQM